MTKEHLKKGREKFEKHNKETVFICLQNEVVIASTLAVLRTIKVVSKDN